MHMQPKVSHTRLKKTSGSIGLSSGLRRQASSGSVVSAGQQVGKARNLTAQVLESGADVEVGEQRPKRSPTGGYVLDSNWMNDVPRMRVRNSETRKIEEMLELAVVNERLAGTLTPWDARNKLEYLKMRRKNWEYVYEYITRQQVTATLEVIEEAFLKAEESLSEEARERNSISQLKNQLVALQTDVADATKKLQMTQSRIEMNISRVNELRAEAVALERMRIASQTTTLEPSRTGIPSSSEVSTSYAPSRPAAQPRGRQGRNKGLQSSMEIEEQLKNFWYPAEFSSRLGKDMMIPFEIFNEPWVLFRDEHGHPACVRDTCAHRACPLSLGKVSNGHVVCAYHGWEFNGAGACTKMPSTPHCKNVGVAALPCSEKDGFIWIWPGDAMPNEVPDYTLPPAGYDIHAEIMVDVPVEHGLLMENLLDLAHAPFTHVSTFARGWPVPDFVKFHASKLLSGNWDPYPINMAFQPPCMVLSLIGLAQPGKIMRGVTAEQCKNHLHQLHVCMPSKKGHTRLLYRMSLDFLPWMRHVPFIDKVWKQVAAQVLGEDLVLVLGQQDRLQRGGDTWSFPVSYDKLAVRYRRWRNSIAAGDSEEAQRLASSTSSVSAGELFCVDEDSEECPL